MPIVLPKSRAGTCISALALSPASRSHEYATLEHLLAGPGRRPGCSLRRHARLQRRCRRRCASSLVELSRQRSRQPGHRNRRRLPKPTAGFQRVIQRAVIHVQSSGREEVTGANVLVAIFAERESHAAFFLQEQDMTRYRCGQLYQPRHRKGRRIRREPHRRRGR